MCVRHRATSIAGGHQLYYFKAWEDFGSGGLRTAVNADSPIDLRKHEPMVATADGMPNRFDLVPTADPLARKWQLQASNAHEASEWSAWQQQGLEACHRTLLCARALSHHASVLLRVSQ